MNASFLYTDTPAVVAKKACIVEMALLNTLRT
jgi:hypothetical protein